MIDMNFLIVDFQCKEGTLLPLLLKITPFTVDHFHFGMERRTAKPVNLGKEVPREVITGSIAVQIPYFTMHFVVVLNCPHFL